MEGGRRGRRREGVEVIFLECTYKSGWADSE